MTQEQKRTFLMDLCGRLCYGIFVEENRNSLDKGPVIYTIDYHPWINNCRPYFRPMSSMTEEEVQEIRDRLNSIPIGRTITKKNFEKCCDFLWFTKMSSFECVSEKMMDVVISYLNEKMFDYRGLIPMGIALPAPEGMYNF